MFFLVNSNSEENENAPTIMIEAFSFQE